MYLPYIVHLLVLIIITIIIIIIITNCIFQTTLKKEHLSVPCVNMFKDPTSYLFCIIPTVSMDRRCRNVRMR